MNTSPLSSQLGRSTYTDEFKQKALQQVARGQSLEQVALSLGISKNSLLRWKSLAHNGSSTSSLIEKSEITPTAVTDPSTATSSPVEATALPMGEEETASADGLPSIPGPGLLDKRRLYDDTFKADVKRQIDRGASIRQLHQTLGVSQVTLHKWKKENARPAAANLVQPEHYRPNMAEIAPSSSSSAFLAKAPGYTIEGLLAQLHTLEAERDTLKKALRILLHTD